MGNRKHYEANKERLLKKAADYYQKNKETIGRKVRDYAISKYFPNLTKEQALATYHQMVSDQNNLCAICKRSETKTLKKTGAVRSLSIDHCHTTGKVRGLLCFDCNTTLGKMERNLTVILKYLGVK